MSTPLNILLAEDNGGDVRLIREALLEHEIQCELFVVSDGALALDYIDQMGDDRPCPDIFLLDLNLPKVDGLQVLAHFRNHPLCTSTPVVVITSSDAPRDRANVGKLGPALYFRKPMEFDEFMRLGALVKEAVEPNRA
jgi:chemotaxis family two-component system response regulator Rcp1